MKRFVLFSGNRYYPSGGASDMSANCDTLEECQEKFAQAKQLDYYTYPWANVLDTETGTVVWEWDDPSH